MDIIEVEKWLEALPLNEPVNIDGESVYLKVSEDGAELGVHFMEEVTDQQIQDALQQGFQNALEFNAGWSLSSDGSILLLSQWLPGVGGWMEVAETLEQLLNQVEQLRMMEVISNVKTENIPSRDEQRFRSRLMEKK